MELSIILFTTVILLFYGVNGFNVPEERAGSGVKHHNNNPGKHVHHVTHSPGKHGPHRPANPGKHDDHDHTDDYETSSSTDVTEFVGSSESEILFENAGVLLDEAFKTFLQGLIVFVTQLVNSLIHGGITGTTPNWDGSSSSSETNWPDTSPSATDESSSSDMWFSWPDWWHTASDSWNTNDDGVTPGPTTTSRPHTTTAATTTGTTPSSPYPTTISSSSTILGMVCFPNGFKEPYPYNELYYYKCEKNRVVLKQCPNGQIFDIPSLSCS